MLSLSTTPSTAVQARKGHPSVPAKPVRCVQARASKPSGGFGKSNKKRIETAENSVYVPRKPRLSAAEEQQAQQQQASTSASPSGGGGSAPFFSAARLNAPGGNWVNVEDNIDEFFKQAGKEVKAKTLAAGRTIMLYRHKGTVYCSDVESSTYKYPMVDAKLMDGPDGAPIVEVPLDGTKYLLRNGEVLEWTPEGKNPAQKFLNNLKKATPAQPLAVYPTEVKNGSLMVRLT
mmetsp:Transcript_12987/g.35378  ORF Transcript_12987/g.35378 Transcript_12987/m.35378 type:complete len:232 (+) Transcript_12987:153-848(+)|eukprot:CAMPEP_0202351368 /NCGR_PEP_ID=MMETSP1126-20121109/8042_1 /ASSEMBLY_ACC=CAM_ASM_000457 /TAXON_ID=3047 /ORGANISM="Dunaliella tertiolecta, Strain CCMP1320" /LENGTH=231 /DNA_ID=CAMNT_0048943473 /DNA_START=52 /DNA_END=747 /DNA_ORIENTATION=-